MADRKRARGFALMDASFAADAKFLRLSRRAASPSKFAAAVGVFWLILADCRRASSPEVTWADYEEYGEEIALLKEVGLLLPNGFVQPTFERWAPAYKSPWDIRRGTQGYAEVPEGTQGHAASALLASSHIEEGNKGGVGETQGGLDAFELACRLLTYVPNSDDWRRELMELEAKHGTEQTVIALQDAYRAALNDGRKLSPFDLLHEGRSLLKLDQHREDKALTKEEQARRAEWQRAEQARMLEDVKRQQDEEFQKYHPDWKPA